MKKLFLSLIGACFALGANAQFEWNIRAGEWQLDSMYTIDKELGQRLYTDVYEYNADGTLAVLYTTSLDYDYFLELYVSERTKTVVTYDNGRMAKVESFWQQGNDWVIMTRSEMSDYDANGNPGTIIYYEADEDDAGQMLPSVKWEVTKWGAREPADYKLYQPDFGNWDLYSTTVSELDGNGLVVKQTNTTHGVGAEYVSTTTYEYDDHGFCVKETSTSDFGVSETTYVNIYDANGNIQTVTEFDDGKEDDTDYYFWSNGGKTAINGMKLKGADGQWFDLSGRRLNGQPTRKGLFIQNGKKVIR